MSLARPAFLELDVTSTQPVQAYGWNGGPLRLVTDVDGRLAVVLYGWDGSSFIPLKCTSDGKLIVSGVGTSTTVYELLLETGGTDYVLLEDGSTALGLES